MTKQTFFTLGEAAKQVGKSKATLSNAIKTGKLSVYEKTDNGFRIDAAELFRVFPKNSSVNGPIEQTRTADSEQPNTPAGLELQIELAELRAKLKAAELRITDRDRIIEDYRRRLDQEGEDRRRLTSMMITDERQRNEAQSLWKRLGQWMKGGG